MHFENVQNMVSVRYFLNQLMGFDQTCLDTYCKGKGRLDFGDLDLIFKVTPAL